MKLKLDPIVLAGGIQALIFGLIDGIEKKKDVRTLALDALKTGIATAINASTITHHGVPVYQPPGMVPASSSGDSSEDRK